MGVKLPVTRFVSRTLIFWTKSGTSSGSLARVLPIIGWDRELIRLQQESLPPYSFKLSGIKTILELMEKNGAARLDPWEIFVWRKNFFNKENRVKGFCQKQLADLSYFLFLLSFFSMPFYNFVFLILLSFLFFFYCYLLFFRLFRLLFTIKITACATNIY